MIKFNTTSDLETVEIGKRLGRVIGNNHAVVLLDGNLAAGKTTFTKGIAEGLNIKDIIKSPTFTIMRQYESDINKLYHLDLYRLNEMGLDFDLEEYVDDFESVIVIEWPFQLIELLPSEYIKVELSGLENKREITITAVGKVYEEVINKL